MAAGPGWSPFPFAVPHSNDLFSGGDKHHAIRRRIDYYFFVLGQDNTTQPKESAEPTEAKETTNAASSRPVMVFDGDCGFCRTWIARWEYLTGDRIEYVPYQQAADRFPHVSEEEFSRAVHFIEPSGTTYRAAHAVFRSLSHAPGKSLMLWTYRHVPLVAPVSEAAYRFVAKHRRVASAVTGLLWGKDLTPPTYHLSRWLTLRMLAVVYFIAFASLLVQILGLIGSDGILPVSPYLDWVHQRLGGEAYTQLPTLCWLDHSDAMLRGLCFAGMAASVLLFFRVAPALMLVALWTMYLSLTSVGRVFLNFQWDALLLEAGLLAIFFAPWRLWPRLATESPPARIVLFLFRWLIFRLMFLSGIVKLSYGDEVWWNLTALTYHYETQPLPAWTSWYAHQLPVWFQMFCCGATYVIEMVMPFLFFTPRRPRMLAGLSVVFLMVVIGSTGNYNFFNLLTIVLCIPLFDDLFLSRFVPRFIRRRLPSDIAIRGRPSIPQHSTVAQAGMPAAWRNVQADTPAVEGGVVAERTAVPASVQAGTPAVPGSVQAGMPAVRAPSFVAPSHRRFVASGTGAPTVRGARWRITLRTALLLPLGVVIFAVTTARGYDGWSRSARLPDSISEWLRPLSPFRSFNSYGLFRVMTTRRPEIIIEGSNDGVTWLPYEFKWKPGDVMRRPRFVQPHQPRLDWQMWFAALGSEQRNRWVGALMQRMLEGSPEVLAFFAVNPFPDSPPRYIRAVLYDYHFTDAETRETTGAWWTRERIGMYIRPFALTGR